MKVLFICHQNVGRSQMAKAFYNHLSKSSDAEAAGTSVDVPGQTIAERKRASDSKNFYVLDVMNEVGIDMSQATRIPLTEEMHRQYDIIVSMEKRENTPEWLLNSPKYVYWDVPDPRGQDLVRTRATRDDITQRVENLFSELRNSK